MRREEKMNKTQKIELDKETKSRENKKDHVRTTQTDQQLVNRMLMMQFRLCQY